MTDVWEYLQRRLGTAGVRTALHRLETRMGKLSDELEDISRRQDAIREAVTASNTNVRAALERMEAELDALRNGDLTDEQQARVDAIKEQADQIRAAAESTDDGYEPPIVEPAPVPGVEGEPAPGSVEDRQRGGF